MIEFLYFIIFGAVAGWLAGVIVKGYGMGLLGNVIVGIVGSMLGGWLFSQFGASAGGGLIGSLITAVVGAVVLLVIIGFIRKSTR